MISVDQRAFLLITATLIVSIIVLLDLFRYENELIRYRRFIFVLIFLFPLLDLNAPPIELNFKFFELALLIFVVINIRSLLIGISRQKAGLILLFGIYVVLVGLTSEFPINSVMVILKLVLYYFLFHIFTSCLQNGWRPERNAILIIAVLAILFFIGQIFFGIEFSLYHSLNEVALRDLRYTSFSQDPQKAALIMYVLAIVLLGSGVFQKGHKEKVLCYSLFGLCVMIGFLTGSRATFLGFALSLLLFFLGKLNLKKVLLTVVFFVGFIISFDYVLSLPVFQRFSSFQESLDGRLTVFWLNTLTIFFDNLWFGIGYGNFPLYVETHMKSFTYGTTGITVDQPESGYLLWLVETGIIGAAFYVVFIVKTLYSKISEENRPYKLAIIVWLLGFTTVYSLSDSKVLFLVLLSVAVIFYPFHGARQKA